MCKNLLASLNNLAIFARTRSPSGVWTLLKPTRPSREVVGLRGENEDG